MKTEKEATNLLLLIEQRKKGTLRNDVYIFWRPASATGTDHISLAALIVGIVVRVPLLAAGRKQLVSSRLSAKIRVVRNVWRALESSRELLTG